MRTAPKFKPAQGLQAVLHGNAFAGTRPSRTRRLATRLATLGRQLLAFLAQPSPWR